MQNALNIINNNNKMAKPNLINGTDFIVKFGPTDGGEEVIFCSTSCTLNVSAATTSASCKSSDGSWTQNVEGAKSWDVSVDGLYAVNGLTLGEKGFVDLMDLFTEGPNEAYVVVGAHAATDIPGEDNVVWKGQAILTSASVTAPDGEISTWSATFTGDGALTKEAVPVP